MTDTPTDRQAVEALARRVYRYGAFRAALHEEDAVNAGKTLRALRDKLDAAEAKLARMEAALRSISDATDLYEPCGWAVNRARAALQGEG